MSIRSVGPLVAVAAAALLSALPVSAQRRAAGPGRSLVVAADANRDQLVTADEWTGFVAGLPTQDDGTLAPDGLRNRVLFATVDKDADGSVTRDDLDAWFATNDADSSGSLADDELRTAAREGLAWALILAAANRDGGALEGQEWTAFADAGAPEKGPGEPRLLPLDTFATWLRVSIDNVDDANRAAMTPGVRLLTLDASFDTTQDGRLTVDDLNAAFAALDSNGDGQITAAERNARPRQRANRTGAGGIGWRRPTDADRARPPQMPWQRSLDDALALVAKTDKPLLICVNIDGETACEHAAWILYRDPEFAALADGFVCVVASPDRHSTRDYDDAGRRLVDPRLGRVLDPEHIDIEPALYERYFGGRRVAPRHVGVAPDGSILFDVFLTQGFGPVLAAMREHAKPAATAPDASNEPTLDALLRSPDAADRERLEAGFYAGDDPTRVDLAERALDAGRRTQHPELVRMALRDTNDDVRRAALRALSRHPDPAPLDLFRRGLAIAHPWPGLRASLLDAMHRRTAAVEDASTQQLWRGALRAQVALALESSLVDERRWLAALDDSAPATLDEPTVGELEALDARLAELDRDRAERPDDAGLALAAARTTMRYAQIEITRGVDPRFLLEDARIAATKAASGRSGPDGAALAIAAWSSWMLNEPDRALRLATRALPRLVGQADSELALRTLDVFTSARTRPLFDAIQGGAEWPLHWAADVTAAYRVLVAHPFATEAQFLRALDFASAVDDWGSQLEIARQAVRRFPGSARVHEYFRSIALADVGASGMNTEYDALVADAPDAARATLQWFAGLAAFVAAERHLENRDPGAARADYNRSVRRFGRSAQAEPAFADSANHYVCLASAGQARLLAADGDLEGATARFIGGLTARPGSVDATDGTGTSPSQTGRDLLDRARAAGADELAERLTTALERAGVDVR